MCIYYHNQIKPYNLSFILIYIFFFNRPKIDDNIAILVRIRHGFADGRHLHLCQQYKNCFGLTLNTSMRVCWKYLCYIILRFFVLIISDLFTGLLFFLNGKARAHLNNYGTSVVLGYIHFRIMQDKFLYFYTVTEGLILYLFSS